MMKLMAAPISRGQQGSPRDSSRGSIGRAGRFPSAVTS